jgi:predicted RNA binding protein YcfA (HicA-like mRNA interferase family)
MVAQVLEEKFEYRVVHEQGSHIVLETDSPAHQRIAIPDHKRLRIGTLNAIIRAVADHKNISKTEIIAQFQSSPVQALAFCPVNTLT